MLAQNRRLASCLRSRHSLMRSRTRAEGVVDVTVTAATELDEKQRQTFAARWRVD